jgi:hypothetical protein
MKLGWDRVDHQLIISLILIIIFSPYCIVERMCFCYLYGDCNN